MANKAPEFIDNSGRFGVLERLEDHHRELKRLQKQIQRKRPTQEVIDKYDQEYSSFLDDVLVFIRSISEIRPITDRQIEALIKHCVCGHTWKQVGEYMNINTRSAIELGTRAKKEYYKQVRKEVENNG